MAKGACIVYKPTANYIEELSVKYPMASFGAAIGFTYPGMPAGAGLGAVIGADHGMRPITGAIIGYLVFGTAMTTAGLIHDLRNERDLRDSEYKE